MLHNTAMTKQWTAKWAFLANVFFELYKLMTNKVTFVVFRGKIAPIAPVPGFDPD